MSTPAGEVLRVTGWLTEHGVVHQVNGGWAVDALAGRQTREHGDLDVFVAADHVPDLLAWLRSRGYEVTTDWLPVRVELTASRGRIDVHPMVLDADGNGVQQGLGDEVFVHPAASRTVGTIDGHPVVVADADRLRELRRGYAPRPEDVHDLALLDAIGTEA